MRINSNMHYVFGACNCPFPKDELPADICSAAVRGRCNKILTYIANGGDINASYGLDGWTIIGAACSMGRTALVEKLLKIPELHLNKRCMQDTPLAWALKGDHWQCVEFLLNNSLKCSLDLEYSWSKILIFLTEKPSAWYDVFNIVASYHDFDKVNELLILKNSHFEVDIGLTNFSLERSQEKVIEILKNSTDIAKFLDGTLITVSSLNTSEKVARTLIFHSHEYHLDSIELSVHLCSMKNHLSILPILLLKFYSRISYEVLATAHQAATKAKFMNSSRLLEKALDVRCHIYMPISEEKIRGERFCGMQSPISSVVEETPGTSESTSSMSTPSESIELGTELGTPALEAMASKLSNLAEDPVLAEDPLKVNINGDASPKLINNRSDKVALATAPFSTNDVLKQTVEAQAKVAEALSLASRALAMVTKERFYRNTTVLC